jgi:hypothetical protein
VAWPRAAPSVQARFPEELLESDAAGARRLKGAGGLNISAMDKLASILRGKNPDVWFVATSGPKANKVGVEWPIPELTEPGDKTGILEQIALGEFIAHTAAS